MCRRERIEILFFSHSIAEISNVTHQFSLECGVVGSEERCHSWDLVLMRFQYFLFHSSSTGCGPWFIASSGFFSIFLNCSVSNWFHQLARGRDVRRRNVLENSPALCSEFDRDAHERASQKRVEVIKGQQTAKKTMMGRGRFDRFAVCGQTNRNFYH